MEKKLQKTYLTFYSLLIAQNLWQTHDQILLIIYLKNSIDKCKLGHDNKNCETCGVKYKYCDCFLKYTNFQDNLIEYKCLHCNKSYQRKFDEKLKEQFFRKK